MARFLRISKSACASKEIPILELHLPTVYQRKPRAKLAIINKHLSTADSAIGQVFIISLSVAQIGRKNVRDLIISENLVLYHL